MKKILSKIAQELVSVQSIPVTLHDETFVIEIKTALDATEYAMLVRELASWSFSEDIGDDEEGHIETIDDYAPEKAMFARKYLTLRAFTNIEFPDDMSEVWTLVMNTDLYDQVYECIDEEMLTEIYRAARQLVEARVASITKQTAFNDILNKVRAILNSVSADIDKVDITEVLSTMKDIMMSKDGDLLKAVLTKTIRKD